MSQNAPASGPPQVDLYTRNGFAGPATGIVRSQYTPGYTRVEGDYAPRRLDVWNFQPSDAADPRSMPTAILDGGDVRLEVWRPGSDTAFALKDVRHDQFVFVLDGTARLETDFGVLDLAPLDMVKVPRSVGYRLKRVQDLHLVIAVSAETQAISPENGAVLNTALDVDIPRPYDGPPEPGEYELVIRHGSDTTSYFFDYDPLHMIATSGAPVVERFNLADVHPLAVAGLSAPPARLATDSSTRSMLYYLGARDGGQPPVHHNADYEEIFLYCAGPGVFGEMKEPGTLVAVPKGVIHQGPEENVPEGSIGWLLETRADMTLTPAGRKIASIAETSRFGVHPSVLADSAAG